MVCELLPYILVALVSLGSTRLFGQTQVLGRILGEVRVGRGEFPNRQIMVELRLHGGTVESIYADNEGRFGFDNLQPNAYRVVVNDSDFYPVEERADVYPDVTPYVVLHIVLQAREGKKKDDPVGTRASGSNPYLIAPGEYNKHFLKDATKEYERAVNSERKGKQEQAIAHYQAALKIAPDYYAAHNNLGALYLSRSDFHLAEAEFREAIRFNQNDAEAYFNVGNLYLLTGRYAESQTWLTSGLQRRPDSAFGRFLQGCLSARTGGYADAEANLRQALRLDSSMWQAHLQLVSLYLQQQRKQDAQAELGVFLRRFPSVPAVEKARELLHRLQSEPGQVR